MEPIYYQKKYKNFVFVDSKMEEYIEELLNLYIEFTEMHSRDYTANDHEIYEVPMLGEVYISNLSRGNIPTVTSDKYEKAIGLFFKKFQKFCEYVSNMRLDVDTII
jgi:hypothetical protein